MPSTHRRPNVTGMVGEYEPIGGEPLCARCKAIKSENGDLCKRCMGEVASEKDESLEEQERAQRARNKELYDLAMDAGWDIAELARRAAAGDLPTRSEIMRRMITSYCEGMG